MRRCRWILPVLVLWFWILCELQTAAEYGGFANVSKSVDGNAFTTHAGDTNGEWYEKGTEVATGITGSLGKPEEGEHFYSKICEDIVPIEKWVVSWESAKCVHKIYPSGNQIYGETFGRKNCMKSYYSGWLAYCADCKEPVISNYIYMSKSTAKRMTHVDLSLSYFYKCPHCDNLEQALTFPKHICKDISPNRYFVRYHANLGTGYMEKSMHMVNNATIYEGQEVTPQTTLYLNTYTRKGYEFTGWNTAQDGSGKSFEDGAEIWNVSLEQDDNIVLYAQWEKSESILELDPAGGTYGGRKDITVKKGKYGEQFFLASEELIPPVGITIHFDTMGGESVASQNSNKRFSEWSFSQPFHGILEENHYLYQGENGSVDRLTAMYSDEGIVLPTAHREGYSFGGWYLDKECTEPVGTPGDTYIPTRETTLYAGWVELLLIAKDNYVAHQGKGAVDLTWQQPDTRDKVYLLYQRREDADWVQIGETQESGQGLQVTKNISFSGNSGSYVVPYTGFYTLTLSGAQGGNYGEHLGGKGGLTEGTFYLNRGEKIQYVIGGQNGYSGGGQGTVYANGGGYSMVTSEDRGILMIAGGGGGASVSKEGGPGGSQMKVTASGDGQAGVTGGGGGYRGGIAGTAELHMHSAECKHVHTGVSTTYGGCYTKEAICGNSDISKQEARRVFYYGNVADDGSHKFCERCGSDSCPGHLDIYYRYICRSCNASSDIEIKSCRAVTAYAPDCGMENRFVCGMEEGQILSDEPAYGGSNYVNTDLCIAPRQEEGVQRGNGQLRIVSQRIGVMENNVLVGVQATDWMPPEAISETTIQKTAVTEREIRVVFEKPEDKGTVYYHKAESYDKRNNALLCSSNQTKNRLVSGVVGYRYRIDTESTTEVTVEHAYLGTEEEHPFLVVELSEENQYLHVAAVDKAGNIGPTCHIKISEQDVIYWPLMTEQLQIEEGSHIYRDVVENTYYVRADGNTPCSFTLEGLLCGSARENYQINRACFQVQNLSHETQAGSLSILVPNRVPVALGTYTYPTGRLQKMQEGAMGLQEASYTMVKRFNRCRSLEAKQHFLLTEECDGQRFRITPRVAADDERETVWSLEETDLSHSLYLIGDGKGPDIRGMELLEGENLELSEEEILVVDLFASDTGSGLAEFYVEVRNLENGMMVRYNDENRAGKISFDISLEEEVFQGAFAVCVYAKDRVGNETSIQNQLMQIGLSAYVTRVLAPHTPVFKKGESGVLHMETVGYVERLEVTFPDSLTAQDTGLNRTFVYENPEYIQTEEIPFVVPFGAMEGEMQILVKAYKAGTELAAKPELVTIQVKGNILDELRTRLR